MRNNRLPRVPANWQQAAFADNWFAELTPDDATGLGARLFAIVDEYRGREATENAASVLISVSILPWLE